MIYFLKRDNRKKQNPDTSFFRQPCISMWLSLFYFEHERLKLTVPTDPELQDVSHCFQIVWVTAKQEDRTTRYQQELAGTRYDNYELPIWKKTQPDYKMKNSVPYHYHPH